MQACLQVQKKALIERPTVDKRVELLSIVFRLAEKQEYASKNFKLYVDRIDRYFEKYKNHELIQFTKSIINANEIAYDGPMWMANHLDDNLNLLTDVKDIWQQYPRWTKEIVEKYIPLLQKFYKDTNFEKFFDDNADLYAEVVKRFVSIFKQVDLNWYHSFYGKESSDMFLIQIGLGIYGKYYGTNVDFTNGSRKIYAIMGIARFDNAGWPEFSTKYDFPIMIHEFCHPFVDNLTAKNKSLFWESGERISSGAINETHTTWEVVLDEALVNASMIKYLKDHDAGQSEIEMWINMIKEAYKKTALIMVAPKDTFITVDVSKKYPKKELILQDIMDVEYVALESADEFLCQGVVLSVGKEIMLIKNRIHDGDIFIFNRNGTGVKKINRQGQGPGEYVFLIRVFLDEEYGEIFIDDIMINKILVYDLHGFFLRSIDKGEARWGNTHIFDSDCIIGKELIIDNRKTDYQRFALISKQNGSIVKEFRIYFEKKATWGISTGNGGGAPRPFPIIPYRDSWLLMEPSSDTVYRILPDYSLMPFMARTPPIQSMKPSIFLLPCIFTERYYFLETIKMVYDHTRDEGFPTTHLIYDRIENTLFEYAVFNDDFLKKGPVKMTVEYETNDEIAFSRLYETYELLEAFEKGHLKGRLKEIAAELKDDSNPVIMLVKYKK